MSDRAYGHITKATMIPIDESADADTVPEDPVRAEWSRLEGKFTDSQYFFI